MRGYFSRGWAEAIESCGTLYAFYFWTYTTTIYGVLQTSYFGQTTCSIRFTLPTNFSRGATDSGTIKIYGGGPFCPTLSVFTRGFISYSRRNMSGSSYPAEPRLSTSRMLRLIDKASSTSQSPFPVY